MTGWCSTNSGSITCSSTRPIIFKNLETPTKMERVAGIQTGGSERAFDLYMKARYLDERHPGHGVTFATGTPISNTMVEMYTMQRFLDPEGLRSRGIEHFDAWAATFGEVVDTMEISPDGAGAAAAQPVRPLYQPARTPADVPGVLGCADRRDARPPDVPSLEGGKPTHRRLPDVGGAGRRLCRSPGGPLRSAAIGEKVDPEGRQRPGDHHRRPQARARRAAALGRMPTDFRPLENQRPGRERGRDLARRTAATARHADDLLRHGCEPDAAWGYSVYEEIVGQAGAKSGIPARAIASPSAMPSYGCEGSKPCSRGSQSGCVRVLIGSTAKMGTGTNVQKRLVALHHARRPLEAGRGRAARRADLAAGQRESRIGRHLSLRDRGVVRRLYVASIGDQGAVHRAGDDG